MRSEEVRNPKLKPTKFGFFESAKHKLDRANSLRNEFEAALADYIDSEPVEVVIDEITDGEWHIHAKQIIEAPVHLSLLLGDAIHNYRTALDHLMADIVLANNQTITTATQFPAGKDLQGFKTTLGKIAGQIDSITKAELEAKAPYPSGVWEDLYFLHVFDIADKHNMIIPSVGSATIRNVAFDGKISYPVYSMYFEAEGSEGIILRHPMKPTFDSRIKVEIHIANAPFLAGVPVLKVLEKFRRGATDAINHFADDSRFPSR